MSSIKLFLVLSLILGSIYSKTDSAIFFGEDQSSGLIDLGDGDDMFYWLFKSRSTPTTDPLVFWLTGGPGCSSEMAVFYENGPFTINEDLSLKKNEFSWNNKANLVFIDQPLGTGFSRCTNPMHYARNEDMVSETFFNFLKAFYKKYPEFNKRPLYITGESYAGHYIPAISHYIINHPTDEINFKGLAIGNGNKKF